MDLDFIPVKQEASNHSDNPNISNPYHYDFSYNPSHFPPANSLELSYNPPINPDEIYNNFSLFQSKFDSHMSAIQELARRDVNLGLRFLHQPNTDYALPSINQPNIMDFNYIQLAQPVPLILHNENKHSNFRPLIPENSNNYGENENENNINSVNTMAEKPETKKKPAPKSKKTVNKENIRPVSAVQPDTSAPNKPSAAVQPPMSQQQVSKPIARIKPVDPIQKPKSSHSSSSAAVVTKPASNKPNKSSESGWKPITFSDLEQQQKQIDRELQRQKREEFLAFKRSQQKQTKKPSKPKYNPFASQPASSESKSMEIDQSQPSAAAVGIITEIKQQSSQPEPLESLIHSNHSSPRKLKFITPTQKDPTADEREKQLRQLLQEELEHMAYLQQQYQKEQKSLVKEEKSNQSQQKQQEQPAEIQVSRATSPKKSIPQQETKSPKKQVNIQSLQGRDSAPSTPIPTSSKPNNNNNNNNNTTNNTTINPTEVKSPLSVTNIEPLVDHVLDEILVDTAREITKLDEKDKEKEVQQKQIENLAKLSQLMLEYEAKEAEIQRKWLGKSSITSNTINKNPHFPSHILEPNTDSTPVEAVPPTLPDPRLRIDENALPPEFVDKLLIYRGIRHDEAERERKSAQVFGHRVVYNSVQVHEVCAEAILDRVLEEIAGELNSFCEQVVDTMVQGEVEQ